MGEPQDNYPPVKFAILRNFLIKTISSFFFIGYLPLIPGTFGSAAGLGMFFLLNGSSWLGYVLFVFCIMLLGLLTSGEAEKLLNKKDPGCIVIDEVMGMLIALSFMPADIKIIILGFFIFRILDTFKPFPAGRLQNMHGAIGIMGDDLIAGIYTNIVLQMVLRLNLSKAV